MLSGAVPPAGFSGAFARIGGAQASHGASGYFSTELLSSSEMLC